MTSIILYQYPYYRAKLQMSLLQHKMAFHVTDPNWT